MKKSILLSLFFFLSVVTVFSQLIAFPGAQGFGKYTTGGRGGRVIYVTSLADTNTEGTLRWALGQSGSRTIMFKVSGTITLTSALSINIGDVTIAGQSAPGDGICLRGYGVTVNASNVIVRYMRFRMGDVNNVESDAFGGSCQRNVMIDHCSVSWSVDECCSFYQNRDFTMQWCLISESLRLSNHAKGPHGYGGIWGGWNVSFHHNLMAHHDSRAPRFGTNPCTVGHDTVDYRNNVIYNWAGLGCYGAGGEYINMVNNYYKPGPATPVSSVRARICSIDRDMTSSNVTDGNHAIYMLWGRYYVDGNKFDTSTSSGTGLTYVNQTNSDNWTYGIYAQISSSMFTDATTEKAAMKLTKPLPSADYQMQTVEVAYDKVLAYSGCSKSRDSYDSRIVSETTNGTAVFKGLSRYNGLGSVTYPAGTVIGSTTLTTETTIDWKSTSHPKQGIIDSQNDIKPEGADASWSPWPTLNSTTAPVDTDNDGMPDVWETSNGLNPAVADGHLTTINGLYTNLEMYLSSLVDAITVQQYDAVKLTVLPNSQGKAIPNSGTYVPGETVTVTAEPAVGYKFVRWENATGTVVSTSNPYKYQASSDLTLKAIYTLASDYVVNLSVEPVNAGSILYASGGSYVGGSRINARAVYNHGYEFVKWIDNTGTEISTSDSLSNYIVSKDVTLRAIFRTHNFRIYANTSNIATKLESARTGDTLLLAAGTYSSGIAFQNGKVLTLMPDGSGSAIVTQQISPSGFAATNCGLVLSGLRINRSSDYFIYGDVANVKKIAFVNDTIENINRCLIRTANAGYTMDTIYFDNCIIRNCGNNGWSFIYPKHIVRNVIVQNSTLYNYTAGESFFYPNQTDNANVLNFNFQNNTVYKWGKDNSRAICNSRNSYSTNSVYSFRNNIINEPGATTLPMILNATGGSLSATKNLVNNYGSYVISNPVSSVIEDLTLVGLGLSSVGYTDATNGNFSISETSPIATAGVDGAVLGDPRWIKKSTGNAFLSENEVSFYVQNNTAKLINLTAKSIVNVYSIEGKLLFKTIVTGTEMWLPVRNRIFIVQITDTRKITNLKVIL